MHEQFLTERLNGTIRFVYAVAMILWVSALTLSIGLLRAGSAPVETHADSGKIPEKPPLMEQKREIAMALSAAPSHLRDHAGVYLLRERGYEKVRETSNGFTCVVVRDHPLNLKPTCWDAEGTATIIPRVLREGELLMKGTPVEEIRRLITDDFRDGRFIAPRRPGIAYMLSGDIRNYDPGSGNVRSFPPHVMFYAPNLTNQDIGASADDMNFRDGMLPFVGYQGPHGYMIVVIGSYSMDQGQSQHGQSKK
jgi:hypothetical protein